MGKKNKKGHRQQKSLPVQPEPEPQLQKVAFDPIQPSYKTAPTLSPLNSGNGKLSGRDLHTTPLSMRGRQRQGQVGTPRSEDADASVLLFGGGKLAAVRGQVQAVAVSLCLLGLIHLNCVLWADYIGLMLWAFVLSEAMRIGRERYLYSLRELHGHLKEHNSSGVVYWLLRATGAVHAAERWSRALTKQKEHASFLRDIRPHHNLTQRQTGSRNNEDIERPVQRVSTWRVLRTCLRQQVSDWKSAHSPRTTGSCAAQAAHSLWQVSRWPVALVFHISGAALDNALVSLSIFLVLHLYPISTFVYTTGAVALGILVLLALLSFQTTRKIVGPIVAAMATREFLSIAVILGSIICVVFCVTFLISSALHDLADGTRSLYNYIVANAYTDDNTIEYFLANLTTYAENGYESAYRSYADEEWWPVVAGVRSSLKQGDNGIKLVGDAMDDLRTVYNNTEWWPMVEFSITSILKLNSNATRPGDNHTVMTWGQFGSSAGGIIGDWRSFASSAYAVIESVIDTPAEIARSVLALGVVGLGWSMWLVVVISEWGIWGAMFVYFLFKMTSMRTDVLRVVVGYVVPSDTESTKDKFTRRLRDSFSGVFFLPFNLSFVNAGFMLLMLDMLEAVAVTRTEGKYLLSFVTLLLSLTQILGGYVCGIVALPWAIGRIWLADYAPVADGTISLHPSVAVVGELATQSYNSRKNKSMFLRLLFESIALEFVLFYGCTAIRYSRIQREHKLGQIAANPWVLDFALILGVAKFGLQGMLLGPFLVAIGATVWDALVEAQCKEEEECGIGSAASLYGSGEGDAGNVQSPPRAQQQRPRMERSPGEPGAVSPLIFSNT